jgi:hypothetical protein
VLRRDCFGGGGHADEVRANDPEKTDFRGRLVARPWQGGINALL